MFDIAGKRKWYFLTSGLVIGMGLLAMVYSTIAFGSPVRLSEDFRGGRCSETPRHVCGDFGADSATKC